MSSVPDLPSTQRRRSFVIFVVALGVVASVVAFAFSRGGGAGASDPPSPSSDVSATADPTTLRTACGEIAPDMALRVDALRRTVERVRTHIAAMETEGNADDAEQAMLVVVALENMADAQENQQGVRRATRELGQTLSSICF